MAFTDALTGIPNRTSFDASFHDLVNGRDLEYPFAIMMIDVDRFKQVNDTYGHIIGDRLSRGLADRISANTPPDAITARLGGDEFVVIAPFDNVGHLSKICDALVGSCSAPFIFEESTINSGISIGVSVWPVNGLAKSDLLKKADEALYVSKHNGRCSYHISDALAA